MPRLRVLTCAFACCPPGKPGFTGGESLLGWSLVNQIARFHEVWTLTYAPDQPGIEEAIKEGEDAGIHFHYVALPTWLGILLKIQGGHQFYYYLWQLKAYFAARQLNKTIRFDLFHHVTYANDWMASFIGALLPIPYLRGPGGGAQRIPKGLLKQDSLKGRLSEHFRSIGQWFFRHDPIFVAGQNRARAILICNPEALEALPKPWREKAQLFPVNGVSSTDFAYFTPKEAPNGPFRIISAGKLIRLKGFDLAIRAFEIFSKKYSDAQLTIVDDGPEYNHLEEMVRKSGLGSNVHFEQWMPREKLLQEIASSDVFLFSGLRDGGGAVVVEAMSVGKPVVCLDIGGPAMHISEDSGIKVPATTPQRTVNDLAAALERLYQDRGLRERMGEAAREKALQVYHWDRAGERLQEIYSRVTDTTSYNQP